MRDRDAPILRRQAVSTTFNARRVNPDLAIARRFNPNLKALARNTRNVCKPRFVSPRRRIEAEGVHLCPTLYLRIDLDVAHGPDPAIERRASKVLCPCKNQADCAKTRRVARDAKSYAIFVRFKRPEVGRLQNSAPWEPVFRPSASFRTVCLISAQFAVRIADAAIHAIVNQARMDG